MSEGLPAFTIESTATTRQEAARLDVSLTPDVLALDGMAARLRLTNALPPHIEAVVDYDTSSYNKDIRQPKCLQDEDTVTLWIKAHKLDEPTLTYRLAEAMFSHPGINPAVTKWYEDQEREYAKARGMLFGGMYGVPLLVAGGYYADKVVNNADYAGVGLAVISAFVAVGGLLKQAGQVASDIGEKPHMPYVKDLEPPVRVISETPPATTRRWLPWQR